MDKFTTTVQSSLIEVLKKIDNNPFTQTVFILDNKKVVGIFTDGDLRRCLNNEIELNKTLIRDVMTSEFKDISCDALAIDAAEIMEANKIFSLVVNSSTGQNESSGIITMHQLLEARIV